MRGFSSKDPEWIGLGFPQLSVLSQFWCVSALSMRSFVPKMPFQGTDLGWVLFSPGV